MSNWLMVVLLILVDITLKLIIIMVLNIFGLIVCACMVLFEWVM